MTKKIDPMHGIPNAVDRDGHRYCGACGNEIGAGWWCCWPCLTKASPSHGVNRARACSLCNTADSELDAEGRYCPTCAAKVHPVTADEIAAAVADLKGWLDA